MKKTMQDFYPTLFVIFCAIGVVLILCVMLLGSGCKSATDCSRGAVPLPPNGQGWQTDYNEEGNENGKIVVIYYLIETDTVNNYKEIKYVSNDECDPWHQEW